MNFVFLKSTKQIVNGTLKRLINQQEESKPLGMRILKHLNVLILKNRPIFTNLCFSMNKLVASRSAARHKTIMP